MGCRALELCCNSVCAFALTYLKYQHDSHSPQTWTLPLHCQASASCTCSLRVQADGLLLYHSMHPFCHLSPVEVRKPLVQLQFKAMSVDRHCKCKLCLLESLAKAALRCSSSSLQSPC